MKSICIKFIKVVNSQKASSGFTLIELLVAASLTTLVVGLGGFGLVAMTEKNKKAKVETERRVELNRALEFITDEIRQAKPIATNASANLPIVAPGFDSSNKTPVLTLQIPGVSQRVIYYIESSTSPWLGPKVISRWGPTFGADGNYEPTSVSNEPPVGCNTTTACNPRGWKGNTLVDLIVDSTPPSNPLCSAEWTPNPDVASRTGFYTCVDPTGRIADIHLRGKLIDAYGKSRTPLDVSTKAFSRPYTASFTVGPGGGSGVLGGGSPESGTVTYTQPSNTYFEILGGSITCGAGGAVLPTTTTIKVTPPGGATTSTILDSSTKALNLPPADVGTKITVAGGINSCGANNNFDSEANKGSASTTQQVWTLRNGDTPPLFAPFGGQPNIDSFLKKYLDASGKVKLAENQVIYLFELGATTKTSPAYDMQDLVVLATIAPSR